MPESPGGVAVKQKKTVRDIPVEGRWVLVRADFNVPFEKGTTTIANSSRITASLPTIHYLRERGARIILCSHLGRPGGKVVESLRLTPVAERLSLLLGVPVKYQRDCVGPQIRRVVRSLAPGEVLLLENLRFYPGEEENAPAFARELASLAEVYVNDAFGAAHRAHASVVGVGQYLPAVAGLLMEAELTALGAVLHHPQRPLAAIVGGAKVSDKLAILENLAGRVDMLVVGGGMAATFLKARGLEVGASLVEEDRLEMVARLERQVQEREAVLILPADVVVAERFEREAVHKTVPVQEVPRGWYIMDIGPRTAELVEAELQHCKTVLWNGPVGVFEWPAFARGTERIARALAELKDAATILGGGSTAQAADALGLADKMTHVSTGGGASLGFLEGKSLPGVAALQDKE